VPPEAGDDPTNVRFKLTAEPVNSSRAADCRAKRVGYLLLLAGRNAVEKWKSERATRDGFSERKIAYAGPASGAPSRLEVNGSEVAARGDALPEKRGPHSFAAGAFRQANDVDKPTELAARKQERRTLETGHIREKGIVTVGGLAAESEDLIDSLQLNAA
jgi:hypothetical protein